MSRKLTSLLGKGKLTGEEVGRLMIKDIVETYKDALNNIALNKENKEAKGILTDAQRQTMVSKLETREDIKAYNEYRALHEYLIKDSTLLSLYHKEAQVAIWRLIHLISQLKNAEDEYNHTIYDPTIMTQTQYDSLKDKEIQEVLTYTESIESLVIHALQYYIELYLKGKRTPYNKYFNKAKKELLTNSRIKANYWSGEEGGYYETPDGKKSTDFETTEEWNKELNKYPPYNELITQESPEAEKLDAGDIYLHNKKVNKKYEGKSPLKWITDPTAPPEATKLNVLEYVDAFYYSEETGDNNTFWELKADYPELYKDLIKKISTMKGLEFIKDIPEKEYFNTKLIKWKDLINNKILDYKKFIDDPHIDGYFSIAVLQGNKVISNKIDKQGDYVSKPPAWRNYFRAENFLIDNKEVVISEYEYLISNIKEALIVKEAFNIVEGFIKIPEINVLIEPITFNRDIDYLNIITKQILENLVRYGKYTDERPAEELKQELTNLFIQVDIEALRPNKENIKKAKKMMTDLSIFKGNMQSVYDVLRGGSNE